MCAPEGFLEEAPLGSAPQEGGAAPGRGQEGSERARGGWATCSWVRVNGGELDTRLRSIREGEGWGRW